jgi:hypothetical protein
MSDKLPSSGRLRTREQQKAAKKKGDIRGFFSLPRGRPPKQTKEQAAKKKEEKEVQPAVDLTEDWKPAAKKKIRSSYLNYANPRTKAALANAVDAKIRGVDADETELLDLTKRVIVIPPSTVRRHAKRKAVMSKSDSNLFTVEARITRPALTTSGERRFIQDAACLRDSANNGMSRKELINIIFELCGAKDLKQAENHFDYLIKSGQLPDLKGGGKVVSAQKTTTKRSCIRVEQQLRWHTVVQFTWEELQRLNQPAEEFEKLKAHFTFNLDETGVMGSEGVLKVIGDRSRKKHEKNVDDNRDSITIVRVGNAAGNNGPLIFLATGKKLENRALRNLDRKGHPAGSKVVMTPSAYMTDEAWKELVPTLCKGIRAMPVICDHPDWWLMLSLDGFSSHINVHESLKVFAENKMLIVKEEGDTSQVNQAYDQNVAKADKLMIRSLLDNVRPSLKRVLTQFELIAICLHALKDTKADSWISSFKKVNMHPDYRISFREWLPRVETRQ